jgi:DNA-binding response OmpR family regulator
MSNIQTNSPSALPILLAISDHWREVREGVCQILEENGWPVLVANSAEEAHHIAQSRPLRAIVVTADWALAGTPGLVEQVKGKIPTLTLMYNNPGGDWLTQIYARPQHDYVWLPLAAKELWHFLR